MKRVALLVVLVVGLTLGVQTVALAERSGSATEPDWTHVQLWGDWCNFSPETAAGHSAPQSYSASTHTEWKVTEAGLIVQEVTQVGSMTTDGVTRPFRSTLTTSGPAASYLEPAPLSAGDDFLAPRFFDESLDVDYVWTVSGYYTFEYHNDSGDGAPASYGPTFCS